MTDFGQALTSWVQGVGNEYALPVLGFVFVSALIEHVFPPYPGDAAVAFGMALAFARHWSVPGAYSAALAGSALGSVLTFYFGRWLARPRDGAGTDAEGPRVQKLRAAAESACATVVKRGVPALVFARFVPVGRAIVVVAAGYGKMPAARALPAAVAGSALWNAALLATAAAVGTQYERIGRVLSLYGRVVEGLLAAVALALAARWWVRRKR